MFTLILVRSFAFTVPVLAGVASSVLSTGQATYQSARAPEAPPNDEINQPAISAWALADDHSRPFTMIIAPIARPATSSLLSGNSIQAILVRIRQLRMPEAVPG